MSNQRVLRFTEVQRSCQQNVAKTCENACKIRLPESNPRSKSSQTSQRPRNNPQPALELKCVANMAAFAVCEIIGPKRPVAVVTAAAAHAPGRSKVHRRRRSGNLSPARRTCSDGMTRRAVHLLAAVFCVAKTKSKRLCPLGRSHKLARLVTRATRSHRIRRIGAVTLKTCRVSRGSGRYRLRHAAARRSVTGHARGAQVLRVVESRAKTSQWRKTLHRAGLRICMADRADRTRLIVKLQRMTTGAR